MTADYVALHAAERPDSVALVIDGRAITYAEFDRDLRKVARATHAFGLPLGRSVAVGCDDIYFHWLLLLAFERLGAATISITPSLLADAPLFDGIDLVLAEAHFAAASSRAHHRITEDWRQGILASADEDDSAVVPGGPDDPVRILVTSGTTGVPKRVLVLRGMHDARVSQNALKYRFTPSSRYLVTMPLNVGVVYSCVTACIRLGAVVVVSTFKGGKGILEALSAHGITHITLLPIQLQQMLAQLPQDFARRSALSVFTLGAAVSDSLRQKTLAWLAGDLCSGYGCNEVGIVSFTRGERHDDYEFVCPGVQVETVDEWAQPVPRGQVGEIRIKTACMARGYLDDPETTLRMFREGWFYPGDVGVLHGPRRLRVIGRVDELLNLGGQKWSPVALEGEILGNAAVADAGVCSIDNSEGNEELYVAVVDAGGRDDELLARITQALHPLPLGRIHVVRLAAIPRNAAGKIERDALKGAVAAAKESLERGR